MAKTKKTSEAQESENTALWNELRSTPPEYTKEFKKAGGFSGKSIDPVYRIRRLTEHFGPCGKGWGFVQEDQWSDGGSGAYVVYVRGHLWYMLDGERYQTCSHTGGTDTSRTPDEAFKMAETDALGKCCVDIGLAVDVYMGEHDGDKYQVSDSAPARRPDRDNQGRQQAGTNPSNSTQASKPVVPIVEAEVAKILEFIKDAKDEPQAMAMSKSLFNRLLLSTPAVLPQQALFTLAERMISRRCELATEPMLKNLEETIGAYIKQKWVAAANANKQLELVKRRLGIAPTSQAGSLPLES
jgi:hypothetical protein